MKLKTHYRKRARIGVKKIEQIIKYFCLDLTADKVAEITKLERKTINNWFNYFREVILYNSTEEENEVFNGTVEVDETYCGPKRVRGKRGRGAGMKTIVFGLLKRHGKVYTQVIPDCKASTLKPILKGKVEPGTILNSDGWRGYHGLVDIGIDKHYRVHHGKNEFARGNQHINGIESFWSFMKRRMNKFNGIKKDKFNLHLKESEFRFNIKLSDCNLEKELIKLLKKFTKNLS